MTQTPNPDCPDCGGTGFVPPFMDQCACPIGFAAAVDATAEEIAAATPIVGEIIHSISGPVVWTGTEWKPIETETLSAGEFAAKYRTPEGLPPLTSAPMLPPHKSGDEMFDELMDQANAWDAAQNDTVDAVPATWICDKGSEHPGWLGSCTCVDPDEEAAEFDVVTTTDVIDATAAAANEAMIAAGLAGEPPFFPKVEFEAAPAPSGKSATPAQITLLEKLIAERNPDDLVVKNAKSGLDHPFITTKRASTLIDALLTVPTDPTKKAIRPNNYDGTCRDCGGHVPAKTGTITRVLGRWVTNHLPGGCLTTEAKAELAAERITEPGLYKHEIDGTPQVFRVRKARTSDRLYAELVLVHDHDGTKTVSFSYNSKALAWLRRSNKLTWLEARDFGAAYGACVACGRTLSDSRSLVQQYGSTCAGHFGWPTVTRKQAEAIIAGVLTWDDVIAGLGVLTS